MNRNRNPYTRTPVNLPDIDTVPPPKSLTEHDTLNPWLNYGWVAFIQPRFISPVTPFTYCPACGPGHYLHTGDVMLAGTVVMRIQKCANCDRTLARKLARNQWEIDPRAFPGIHGPDPFHSAGRSACFRHGRANGRDGVIPSAFTVPPSTPPEAA